jgi:hypothetical protein
LSLTAKLNLSQTARAEPLAAWKAALKLLTGVSPLQISLVNPGIAEAHFEEEDFQIAQAALRKHGALVDDLFLTERDLQRRVAAYCHSPFPLLRRQALKDFSGPLKLKLLQAVEESVAANPDSLARKRLKHAVAKDREWLREPEEGESRAEGEGAMETEAPGQ